MAWPDLRIQDDIWEGLRPVDYQSELKEGQYPHVLVYLQYILLYTIYYGHVSI